MKKNNRKAQTTNSAQNKTLSPEQIEKRLKLALKKKIVKTFTDIGFQYIPTNDHEMFIGHRNVEVDALFIYENIWLICEDTVTTANVVLNLTY